MQTSTSMRQIRRSKKDDDRPVMAQEINEALQRCILEPKSMVAHAFQAGDRAFWICAQAAHYAQGLHQFLLTVLSASIGERHAHTGWQTRVGRLLPVMRNAKHEFY